MCQKAGFLKKGYHRICNILLITVRHIDFRDYARHILQYSLLYFELCALAYGTPFCKTAFFSTNSILHNISARFETLANRISKKTMTGCAYRFVPRQPGCRARYVSISTLAVPPKGRILFLRRKIPCAILIIQ